MSLGDRGDASLVEEHFRVFHTNIYGSWFKVNGEWL